MAVEKGFIKFICYRKDEELFHLTFEDEAQQAIDLSATFDEVVLEVRENRNTAQNEGQLIKRLSYTENSILFVDTNKMVFDLAASYEGTAAYDIRFVYSGQSLDKPKTLISGVVVYNSDVSNL